MPFQITFLARANPPRATRRPSLRSRRGRLPPDAPVVARQLEGQVVLLPRQRPERAVDRRRAAEVLARLEQLAHGVRVGAAQAARPQPLAEEE
eukprot:3213149-Prymnesium_polylepis.2